MRVFIGKVLALVIVAIVGGLYYTMIFDPFDEDFITEAYYGLLGVAPICLMYMSPGILVSYLVDFIMAYTKKTSFVFSIFMYFVICFIVFYLPFIIYVRNDIHAVFYFLLIPVLYGGIESFIQRWLRKQSSA